MTSTRTILHVDLDAFYASIEQRDDATLRGRPVVVGGESLRSVVSAASYEARRYGVRSAMPMSEALRRCPSAIVRVPRHAHYAAVSAQIFAIFERVTPLVEGLSLDEAFLDVTASRSLFGDGAAIAHRVKRAVADEVGLTASAGVASSKFVAKIASDLRKPDGLVLVPEDVAAFLAPLPIERMWGLGPVGAASAHQGGFHTLGDLASASPERLERVFGKHGSRMAALARGEDEREVVPGREALTLGSEETYERDLVGTEALELALLAQAARVAARLTDEGLEGTQITVKLKASDFTVRTRTMTTAEALSDTNGLHARACALLQRFVLDRPIRLVGVQVGRLVPIGTPATLFPDAKLARGRAIEAVQARLRARHGRDTVRKGALLLDPSRRR